MYYVQDGGAARGAPRAQLQDQGQADIMRMKVSEQGDEVLIELSGVAGRHQRILEALTDGRIAPHLMPGESIAVPSDVSVRAGADDMQIRLRRGASNRLQALTVYHFLRHELIEREFEASAAVA
jgi:hypothetical protein